MATTINFQAAWPTLSPAETLRTVADACEELSVNAADVYGDFGADASTSWLRAFEREVATATDLDDAVFMPSGVMAQQIALLINSGGPDTNPIMRTAFICHWSSHLLLHENDSWRRLLFIPEQRGLVSSKPDDSRLGVPLEAAVIQADPTAEVQQPLRFDDVAKLGVLPQSTSTIVVELPHREIGGKITPWEDLVRLRQLCDQHGIQLHCDGARLWEATAAYGKSVAEICALFDSVYVSFYKGLGGMTGAMLLGRSKFIAEARIWLRRFGGNLYTLLPYAVSAWKGFRAHAASFEARRDRMRGVVAKLTAATAELRDPKTGRPLLRFDPPVPEVSLQHVYIHADPSLVSAARDAAAVRTGITCFTRTRPAKFGAAGQTCFEFNMGPANGAVDDEVWVRGWRELLLDLQGRLAASAGGGSN